MVPKTTMVKIQYREMFDILPFFYLFSFLSFTSYQQSNKLIGITISIKPNGFLRRTRKLVILHSCKVKYTGESLLRLTKGLLSYESRLCWLEYAWRENEIWILILKIQIQYSRRHMKSSSKGRFYEINMSLKYIDSLFGILLQSDIPLIFS